MYYLVMAMTKHQAEPRHTGYVNGVPQFTQAPRALEWHAIGVFDAPGAEAACKAAAKKQQSFGSFFAIEGHPWGIDLIDVEATEFGAEEDPMSRLNQLEAKGRPG